jgi:hypothetical protein
MVNTLTAIYTTKKMLEFYSSCHERSITYISIFTKIAQCSVNNFARKIQELGEIMSIYSCLVETILQKLGLEDKISSKIMVNHKNGSA